MTRVLGCLPEKDPRSLDHPVETKGFPRKLVSREWTCAKHNDQGSSGGCSAFATGHAAVAIGWHWLVDEAYSQKRIYWPAQKIDRWKGGEYPGAKKKMQGTSIIACMKTVQTSGLIRSYQWCFSLTQLKATISFIGPVVLACPWHHDMSYPDADGVMHVRGHVGGWHALLCTGLDLERKRFRLHNSYGNTWGVGGDAFLTFKALKILIGEKAEMCVARR